MIKICFVCIGNTCRSPMAERLMKKELKAKNITDVKVSSRGIRASGKNIAENSKIALKKLKASAANRKSVKLGKIDQSTIYVVMTEDLKEFVASDKIISFKQLLGYDIFDPYQQNEDVYFECAKQIEEGVKILTQKIINWRK